MLMIHEEYEMNNSKMISLLKIDNDSTDDEFEIE
jgi:hypothetical protein